MTKKKEAPAETMEYESPPIDDNAKELLSALKSIDGTAIQNIQDYNKFLVALELFKMERLPLITHLDKEHVGILTRHDTLVESAKLLFDLPDDAPIFKLIRTMNTSYMKYQVSLSRKSRTEIVNILRNEVGELTRTIGDKMVGKKP